MMGEFIKVLHQMADDLDVASDDPRCGQMAYVLAQIMRRAARDAEYREEDRIVDEAINRHG